MAIPARPHGTKMLHRKHVRTSDVPVALMWDDAVLDHVAAQHLGARRPELRTGAAATRGDIGTREPADAAQQRECDRRAAGRIEHFVLRKSAVGDRQAARTVVNADERLVWVRAERLLPPRLRVPFRQRDWSLY